MCASAHNATALTELLPMLAGGDRRSIGQANRAAAIALAQPGAMAVLMETGPPAVRARGRKLLAARSKPGKDSSAP